MRSGRSSWAAIGFGTVFAAGLLVFLTRGAPTAGPEAARDEETAGESPPVAQRPREAGVTIPSPAGTAPSVDPAPSGREAVPGDRPLPRTARSRDGLEALGSDARAVEAHRSALRALALDPAEAPELRALALWGLGSVGDLEAARACLAADGPVEVRRTAIEMLRRHGGAAAWADLAVVVQGDAEETLRETALRALALVDPARSRAEVARVLRADASARLRVAALDLLGRSADPEALALATAFVPAADAEVEVWTKARVLFDLRAVDPRRVVRELEALAARPGLSESTIEHIEAFRRAAADPAATVGGCANQ